MNRETNIHTKTLSLHYAYFDRTGHHTSTKKHSDPAHLHAQRFTEIPSALKLVVRKHSSSTIKNLYTGSDDPNFDQRKTDEISRMLSRI